MLKIITISLFSILTFSGVTYAQSVNPGEDPNLGMHKDTGNKTEASVAAIGVDPEKCGPCEMARAVQAGIKDNTNPSAKSSSKKDAEKQGAQ